MANNNDMSQYALGTAQGYTLETGADNARALENGGGENPLSYNARLAQHYGGTAEQVQFAQDRVQFQQDLYNSWFSPTGVNYKNSIGQTYTDSEGNSHLVTDYLKNFAKANPNSYAGQRALSITKFDTNTGTWKNSSLATISQDELENGGWMYTYDHTNEDGGIDKGFNTLFGESERNANESKKKWYENMRTNSPEIWSAAKDATKIVTEANGYYDEGTDSYVEFTGDRAGRHYKGTGYDTTGSVNFVQKVTDQFGNTTLRFVDPNNGGKTFRSTLVDIYNKVTEGFDILAMYQKNIPHNEDIYATSFDGYNVTNAEVEKAFTELTTLGMLSVNEDFSEYFNWYTKAGGVGFEAWRNSRPDSDMVRLSSMSQAAQYQEYLNSEEYLSDKVRILYNGTLCHNLTEAKPTESEYIMMVNEGILKNEYTIDNSGYGLYGEVYENIVYDYEKGYNDYCDFLYLSAYPNLYETILNDEYYGDLRAELIKAGLIKVNTQNVSGPINTGLKDYDYSGITLNTLIDFVKAYTKENYRLFNFDNPTNYLLVTKNEDFLTSSGWETNSFGYEYEDWNLLPFDINYEVDTLKQSILYKADSIISEYGVKDYDWQTNLLLFTDDMATNTAKGIANILYTASVITEDTKWSEEIDKDLTNIDMVMQFDREVTEIPEWIVDIAEQSYNTFFDMAMYGPGFSVIGMTPRLFGEFYHQYHDIGKALARTAVEVISESMFSGIRGEVGIINRLFNGKFKGINIISKIFAKVVEKSNSPAIPFLMQLALSGLEEGHEELIANWLNNLSDDAFGWEHDPEGKGTAYEFWVAFGSALFSSASRVVSGGVEIAMNSNIQNMNQLVEEARMVYDNAIEQGISKADAAELYTKTLETELNKVSFKEGIKEYFERFSAVGWNPANTTEALSYVRNTEPTTDNQKQMYMNAVGYIMDNFDQLDVRERSAVTRAAGISQSFADSIEAYHTVASTEVASMFSNKATPSSIEVANKIVECYSELINDAFGDTEDAAKWKSYSMIAALEVMEKSGTKTEEGVTTVTTEVAGKAIEAVNEIFIEKTIQSGLVGNVDPTALPNNMFNLYYMINKDNVEKMAEITAKRNEAIKEKEREVTSKSGKRGLYERLGTDKVKALMSITPTVRLSAPLKFADIDNITYVIQAIDNLDESEKAHILSDVKTLETLLLKSAYKEFTDEELSSMVDEFADNILDEFDDNILDEEQDLVSKIKDELFLILKDVVSGKISLKISEDVSDIRKRLSWINSSEEFEDEDNLNIGTLEYMDAEDEEGIVTPFINYLRGIVKEITGEDKYGTSRSKLKAEALEYIWNSLNVDNFVESNKGSDETVYNANEIRSKLSNLIDVVSELINTNKVNPFTENGEKAVKEYCMSKASTYYKELLDYAKRLYVNKYFEQYGDSLTKQYESLINHVRVSNGARLISVRDFDYGDGTTGVELTFVSEENGKVKTENRALTLLEKVEFQRRQDEATAREKEAYEKELEKAEKIQRLYKILPDMLVTEEQGNIALGIFNSVYNANVTKADSSAGGIHSVTQINYKAIYEESLERAKAAGFTEDQFLTALNERFVTMWKEATNKEAKTRILEELSEMRQCFRKEFGNAYDRNISNKTLYDERVKNARSEYTIPTVAVKVNTENIALTKAAIVDLAQELETLKKANETYDMSDKMKNQVKYTFFGDDTIEIRQDTMDSIVSCVNDFVLDKITFKQLVEKLEAISNNTRAKANSSILKAQQYLGAKVNRSVEQYGELKYSQIENDEIGESILDTIQNVSYAIADSEQISIRTDNYSDVLGLENTVGRSRGTQQFKVFEKIKNVDEIISETLGGTKEAKQLKQIVYQYYNQKHARQNLALQHYLFDDATKLAYKRAGEIKVEFRGRTITLEEAIDLQFQLEAKEELLNAGNLIKLQIKDGEFQTLIERDEILYNWATNKDFVEYTEEIKSRIEARKQLRLDLIKELDKVTSAYDETKVIRANGAYAFEVVRQDANVSRRSMYEGDVKRKEFYYPSNTDVDNYINDNQTLDARRRSDTKHNLGSYTNNGQDIVVRPAHQTLVDYVVRNEEAIWNNQLADQLQKLITYKTKDGKTLENTKALEEYIHRLRFGNNKTWDETSKFISKLASKAAVNHLGMNLSASFKQIPSGLIGTYLSGVKPVNKVSGYKYYKIAKEIIDMSRDAEDMSMSYVEMLATLNIRNRVSTFFDSEGRINWMANLKWFDSQTLWHMDRDIIAATIKQTIEQFNESAKAEDRIDVEMAGRILTGIESNENGSLTELQQRFLRMFCENTEINVVRANSSQPSSDTMLSNNLGEWSIFFPYMGQRLQYANKFMEAWTDWTTAEPDLKEEAGKHLVKLAGTYIAQSLVMAAISTAWNIALPVSRRKYKDEDQWLGIDWGYLGNYFFGQFTASALSIVPVLGPIMSGLINGYCFHDQYALENSQQSNILSWIPQDINNAIAFLNGKTTSYNLSSVINLVNMFLPTGVPLVNLMKLGDVGIGITTAVYDMVTGNDTNARQNSISGALASFITDLFKTGNIAESDFSIIMDTMDELEASEKMAYVFATQPETSNAITEQVLLWQDTHGKVDPVTGKFKSTALSNEGNFTRLMHHLVDNGNITEEEAKSYIESYIFAYGKEDTTVDDLWNSVKNTEAGYNFYGSKSVSDAATRAFEAGVATYDDYFKLCEEAGFINDKGDRSVSSDKTAKAIDKGLINESNYGQFGLTQKEFEDGQSTFYQYSVYDQLVSKGLYNYAVGLDENRDGKLTASELDDARDMTVKDGGTLWDWMKTYIPDMDNITAGAKGRTATWKDENKRVEDQTNAFWETQADERKAIRDKYTTDNTTLSQAEVEKITAADCAKMTDNELYFLYGKVVQGASAKSIAKNAGMTAILNEYNKRVANIGNPYMVDTTLPEFTPVTFDSLF